VTTLVRGHIQALFKPHNNLPGPLHRWTDEGRRRFLLPADDERVQQRAVRRQFHREEVAPHTASRLQDQEQALTPHQTGTVDTDVRAF
jgi:hypothetical protein